jgi:hypothetical protein
MRKLWSDHVIWTREYIVAAIGGSPDANAAATRLLKNQDDIGGAVAGFYGKDPGDKLTGLLKQHIMIAVDLIAAAKANDQVKYNDGPAVEEERRGNRGLLKSGEPELAQGYAGRHDGHAPGHHHQGSRGQAKQEMG